METPALWLLPFAALLLSIAVLPLTVPVRWGRPGFQALVAGLAALPVAFGRPGALGHVVPEYLSFVLLLGSLYVVTSGIRITGDIPARPATNVGLLAIGGLLASIIGTTGASMLLIRLVLEVNSERKNVSHTVLFFILVVSNVGGCLTPLGDPPLFLGYLAGVPFFWTLRLVRVWALALAALLGTYFLVERRRYAAEPREAIRADETTRRPIRISGRWNLPLLCGIVAATAFLEAPYREAAYLLSAALSFPLTPRKQRTETGFSWHPILEVAILFAGIFVTMEPALAVLRERAPMLGFTRPWQFFWATGALSACLDNAPTYAAFLALARGLGRPEVAGVPAKILEAISTGAVFFGALTYIGNGPNFLVRSIAVSRGVAMPSFFGFAARAAAVLLPLFVLITFVFFRG
ncbi:MAG: sodium:proton antiporter [Acidobacteriota bacterium]|nr:sodium:proton antiporter [Acidobacteriota bacterium]